MPRIRLCLGSDSVVGRCVMKILLLMVSRARACMIFSVFVIFLLPLRDCEWLGMYLLPVLKWRCCFHYFFSGELLHRSCSGLEGGFDIPLGCITVCEEYALWLILNRLGLGFW